MPQVADNNAADRALGAMIGTHPRLDGSQILEPQDVLERLGDFTVVDAEGNPLGMKIGKPGVPNGWGVWIGPSPTETYRQNAAPLGNGRPSFFVNQPIGDGPAPNGPGTPSIAVANLPRPEKPIVRKEAATLGGYPASTTSSPHWYAWTRVKFNGHSPLSPPTPFHGDHGQSYRIPIPDDVGEGVTQIGLWLAEPGKSRPERPGPMYLQRVIDLTQHFLPHYDLTGPYRYVRGIPTGNETILPTPAKAQLWHRNVSTGARHGTWYVKITWEDDNGQETAGSDEATQHVSQSGKYSKYDEEGKLEFAAGKGPVRIYRPAAPPGATGWRAYVYFHGQGGDYGRVVDRIDGTGGARAWPIDTHYVETTGWSGDEEHYGRRARVIVEGGGLPDENGTGIEGPDSAPEVPLAIGASRPEPGTYYVRVADAEDEVYSLPSEAVRVDLGENEIMRVIPVDPSNRFSNPTYVEVGPDLLPMGHDYYAPFPGAYVEGSTFVLECPNGPIPEWQLGDEGELVEIDVNLGCLLHIKFSVELPKVGSFQGRTLVWASQHDANGVHVRQDNLKTFDGVGDFEQTSFIAPTGSSGLALHPSAKFIKLRLGAWNDNLGGLINMKMRTRHRVCRWYPWWRDWWWWWKRKRRPPVPPVDPTDPVEPPPLPPPPDDTAIEPPPEPPTTPELYPVPRPRRPLTTGTVLESLNFETGLPGGWEMRYWGGGALSADAAAALYDSAGLRSVKSAGGAYGAAHLRKDFAPDPGYASRHGMGLYGEGRVAGWPSPGFLLWNALARPTSGEVGDTDRFAWSEAGATAEVAEVTITESPSAAGSVNVILNGVTTSVAVVALKEKATVNITGPATSAGAVTVTLNGTAHAVQVGGTTEEFNVYIDDDANYSGYVYLTLDGVRRSTWVHATDSESTIAEKIRAIGWPGWTVWRSGTRVYFSAQVAGPRTDPVFDRGVTGIDYAVTVTRQGLTETAADLAARLRATSFAGYTVSGSGTTAIFEATSPGARTNTAFSAGSTGVTFTLTQDVDGAVDTPSALAARIRGTAFSGWDTSGTGATVRWTATAPGTRQNLVYDSLATGAIGTYRTVTQGSEFEISAVVRDSLGATRKRRIIAGLSTTARFKVDCAVSGAGTDNAIVTFWAAKGTDPLEHVARFEEVDLSNHPAGGALPGVVAESSSALTWEVHTDDVRVSDRGLQWYRDHNALGEFINQLVIDNRPGHPVRQDLGLQDMRIPVVEGGDYALSAFVMYEGIPATAPARPLHVTAHLPKGEVREVGDLVAQAATGGVSGTAAWAERGFYGASAIAIPDNCTELRINSRDVSEGLIIIQEVTPSPGTAVNRGGLYAATGEYVTTHSIGTPNMAPFLTWGRKRVAVISETHAPDGTVVSAEHRASASGIAWTDAVADPDALPQLERLRHRYVFSTTDRTVTPALRPGSPRAHYRILRTPTRPVATLLRADGTEFDGGVHFTELQEWEPYEATAVHELASGALTRHPLPFGTIGLVPPGVVEAYTPATKNWLAEYWGRVDLLIEAFGSHLLIKLGGRPEFKRTAGTEIMEEDGTILYAQYVSPFAGGYVLERREVP